MQTLKPCPFCNGTDVNLHQDKQACMSWVSCKSCGLEAPSETGVTDEQAISYWNTRPAAPVECQPCSANTVECHETASVTDKTPVEGLETVGTTGGMPGSNSGFSQAVSQA